MKKLPFLFIVLTLFVFGCQRTEEFKYEGKKGGILIVSIMNEPTTLNPLYPSLSGLSPVIEKLFTPLHEVRPDGKIRPGLAQSWVYSEDLKSITYTIRNDAEWHDGKPITVEDIVFTVKQIKNSENRSPLYQRCRYIKNIEAIDRRRVRFTFEKVYADELLHSNIIPIPMHKIEKDLENLQMSDFSFVPTGNGPYKLNEWNTGKWIELVANPNYFQGRPPLDRIVFYFPSSMEELLDEIKSGNIDIAYDLPPAQYDTIEGYKTIVSAGEAYAYIGWNLERFKDKKLRKTLTMAIDRESIISEILKGFGSKLNGPIPPKHWAFNPKTKEIPYNKDMAITLIKELGYKKKRWEQYYSGIKINILVEKGNPLRIDVAEAIVSDLKAIRINATITELSGSQLIKRLFDHDFDAYILGWSVKKALNPLQIWSSGGSYNFVGYKNEEVNHLMREALLSLDRENAKKAWYRFQEIISEDIPYTFLYAPQNITLVKKNIGGINRNDKRPLISILDELWFEKPSTTTIELASLGEHYKETQGEQPERITTSGTQSSSPAENILQAAAPTTVPEEKTEEPEPLEEKPTEETPKEEKVVKKGPILPPTLSYAPPRKYPEVAEKLDIRGQVFVEIHITKKGTVDRVKILRGLFPACDTEATKEAYQMKFDPAIQDGEPVEYTQTFPFRFPPPGW